MAVNLTDFSSTSSDLLMSMAVEERTLRMVENKRFRSEAALACFSHPDSSREKLKWIWEGKTEVASLAPQLDKILHIEPHSDN